MRFLVCAATVLLLFIPTPVSGHAGHVHVFDAACTAAVQAVAAFEPYVYVSDWNSRQLFEVRRGTWEVERVWDVPAAPGSPDTAGGREETEYRYFEVFASPTAAQPRRLAVLEQNQVAHLDAGVPGDDTQFGAYAAVKGPCGLRTKARSRRVAAPAGQETLLLDVTNGTISRWDADNSTCVPVVTDAEVSAMRAKTQGITLTPGDQADFHFWGFEYVEYQGTTTFFHLTRNLGDGRVTVWRNGSVDLGLDLLRRDLDESHTVWHGYGELFWHPGTTRMFVTNGEGDLGPMYSPNAQDPAHPNGKIWAFDAFASAKTATLLLYAAGLRQPWHSVLDYGADAILLADVGENYYEKMVRVPLPATLAELQGMPRPALNLLWPVYEGFSRYTLGVTLLSDTRGVHTTQMLWPTVEWKHCLQDWLLPVIVAFWFMLLVFGAAVIWLLAFWLEWPRRGAESWRPSLLFFAFLSLLVVALVPFPVFISQTALREANTTRSMYGSDTQTSSLHFGLLYGFETVEDMRTELWIPSPDLRAPHRPGALWYLAWGFSLLAAWTQAARLLVRVPYPRAWDVLAALFVTTAAAIFFSMRCLMANASGVNVYEGILLFLPAILAAAQAWIAPENTGPKNRVQEKTAGRVVWRYTQIQ